MDSEHEHKFWGKYQWVKVSKPFQNINIYNTSTKLTKSLLIIVTVM